MESIRFSVEWAMPNRWTFQIPPIKRLLDRWLSDCHIIVDPFCGTSKIASHRNDLGLGGEDAEKWCWSLIDNGIVDGTADAVLFDPPYSPRQISECYQGVGKPCTPRDTQNARLYKSVREPLRRILRPGGVAISFGWSSSGFGRLWPTEEILLVQHGSAHNDTICVVQRKPINEVTL